jgi:hypothetical protein
MDKGGAPTNSYRMGEDRGDIIESELIHDRGKTASTILCRQGGMISTSRMEALIRFRCGCSKSLSHEVMCSPWLRGGPWQRIVVGRELPSSKLLFLDGDAWRTPARSGGGA